MHDSSPEGAPAGHLDPADLVGRMGGHAASELGVELEHTDDDGVARWWVLAVLLGALRGDRDRAIAAARALRTAGLSHPDALRGADPATVAGALDTCGVRPSAPVAARLVRSSRALAERWAGSFDALAAEADGLEDLGGRLASLSPGVGAGTVVRFLRPLRERWTAAGEIPLDEAARAAAVHLGWIAEGDDLEGAPGSLRRSLVRVDTARAPDAARAAFSDVEAALERLGRAACRRERPDRCPLGVRCPARA